MPVKRDKALIKVGPFTGGVNLLQKRYPTEYDDTECREIINLDPTDDALVARRGFRAVIGSTGNLYAAPLLRFTLLGIYFATNKDLRPIVGKVTATNATSIYLASTGNGITWSESDFVQVGTSYANEFCAAVFYNGFYYLVPLTGAGTLTNSYKLTSALALSGVALTTIPKGDKAFIWKDRMWVLNKGTNTISWSKSTDPTIFAAPDGGFVTISGIDGQLITDMIVINDTMYIFKDNSYYQFNYNVNPSTDGYLREVSRGIGAYTVLQHEDRTFLVNRDGVHEFINGNISGLSDKIAYKPTADTGNITLNVLNNMLIVGNNLGEIDIEFTFDQWAMNLDTGAWTTYISSVVYPIGPYTKGLICTLGAYRSVLWGHNQTILSFAADTLVSPTFEFPNMDREFDAPKNYYSPEYQLTTKTYDLDDPAAWKKITSIAVEGRSLFPVVDADVTYKLFLDVDDPASDNPVPITSVNTNFKEDTVGIPTGVRRSIIIGRYRCRMFTLSMIKPSAVFGLSNSDSPTWFNMFYVTVVRKAYETLVKNAD